MQQEFTTEMQRAQRIDVGARLCVAQNYTTIAVGDSQHRPFKACPKLLLRVLFLPHSPARVPLSLPPHRGSIPKHQGSGAKFSGLGASAPDFVTRSKSRRNLPPIDMGGPRGVDHYRTSPTPCRDCLLGLLEFTFVDPRPAQPRPILSVSSLQLGALGGNSVWKRAQATASRQGPGRVIPRAVSPV